MQARYYDPVIGRFMSNDPIGFRDVHSFNRYAYANNNPYKYVDPDGRYPESWSEAGNLALGMITTAGGVAQGVGGLALITVGIVDVLVGSKAGGTLSMGGGLWMISASGGTMVEGMQSTVAAWNNKTNETDIANKGPLERATTNLSCSDNCVKVAKATDTVLGAVTGNARSAQKLTEGVVNTISDVASVVDTGQKMEEIIDSTKEKE